MRINKVVGIDIGTYRIKVSYVVKGHLKKFFYENVPDNSVKNGLIVYWDAMAEFLRDTLKAHGIKCRNAIFSIPTNGTYIRTVELPRMNIQQLELNLPFEFHDYISESTDKYFYDYAVIESDEKSMKLLAVACSKETINHYRTMAKNAKLKPVGLVPDVIGLQRILEKYNQLFKVPQDKDYALLDMGDQSFKIHFFRHGTYDVSRSLEPGGRSFAEKIADIQSADIHIARLAEEDNLGNIQSHPELIQQYESRAVEIMRALNFYSYSNTSNTIDTLYYYGGGSNVKKLVKMISETLNLPVKPISYLYAIKDDELRTDFIISPQSYGVTIDPDEKFTELTDTELQHIAKHIDEYEQSKAEELLEDNEKAVETVQTEASDESTSEKEEVESLPVSDVPEISTIGEDEKKDIPAEEKPEDILVSLGSSDEDELVTLGEDDSTNRAIEELTRQFESGYGKK
ncbi:pilus assembly protein PilM [Oribacterium sp. WCC10]|uniref:pilus assembly protein PilM n=1 Tax=Oribacterium sp. WCC10 TaxID=1855343 RepID=UPI0008E06258|nr:pilus assembly protein PilM [Oribacterium sp. WCC10]SFG29971.1 type IV pilus assembly protein PilM [Oribacterium sp. WCC10]